MARSRPEEPEAVTEQPLEVLSGLEAVARTEREICRKAVTGDAATAEGLALAGVRAASLSNGAAVSRAGGVVVAGASCVHHTNNGWGRDLPAAFELVAASAQEAIDHCLVAHLLSQRVGRPGLCSLAPSLARDLTLVRLPDRRMVDDVLGTESGRLELEADPDRIVELACEALRTVTDRTARPVDLVGAQGVRDATVVLVGSGLDAARVQETARVLSEGGVRAGAVSVNLVRPFPESAVREALASARTVLVVDEVARRDALVTRVRAALDEKQDVHAIESAPVATLLQRVAEHLPTGAFDAKRYAPAEMPLGRRLVVAPAGAWGEETVRQVASALSQLGRFRMGPRTRRHLGATMLVWGSDSSTEEGEDLLLASHPALLEPEGALALARSGGSAIVLSAAESSYELARMLSPEARDGLRERQVRVHWLSPPDPDEGDPGGEAERAASFMLAGAVLAALDTAGEAAASGAAEAVATRLEAAGRTEAAHWLRAGATRLQSLDPADLDPSRHIEEVDFRPVSNLPRMPEAVDDPAKRERWIPRVRQFHWTGKGAFSAASGLPVRPAVLESLAQTLRLSSPHPFVLVPSDDPERPVAARSLRDLLAEACEALRGQGRAARTLGDGIPRLVTLSAELVSRQTTDASARSLVADAGRRLVEELRLSSEQETSLVDDLSALGSLLPDAIALDLKSDTPVRLYLSVLEASRGPLRQRFIEELETLREQLRDLLELDRLGSSKGRSPKALASTLGRAGSDYLDPAALSRTLAGERGSQPLEPARRERIEETLRTIEGHLDEQDRVPQVVLLRPPDLEFAPREEDQREHPEPLAAAVGVFDGLARRMGTLFQAVRLARLEATGQSRPEVYSGGLPELDWEAFTARELMLVPAVAVVTTGRRLRQTDQGALSDLVRSSRPVHVIVVDEVGAPDEAEDLSRFHIDLGYLVVAHREAYAVGSTLARPDRAVEALNHVARALRPAVALMRLPTQQPSPWRALLAEAALQGRVCPDFRYDPDAGLSWADRFDVDGNPQPERPWPIHPLAFLENGNEQSLEMPFTFADAVALEPAYLRHLRIVPRAAWDDDQIPLGEYLEQFHPESRERRIPYVWVIDEQRTLQRAVVTRELAVACWDRLRSWRVLQELAGYENVFAERAAARARDAAVAEAETLRAELEKTHANEVERVRTETARESIEKLAAALISPEGMAAAASALAPGAAAGAVPEPVPVEVPTEAPAAEPAPVEEEEVLAFDEPFIDAPLCTTCNECTNINGRLFKYNDDKQAFIADTAAGTFEELVRSAELCPAACIHPGKPRAGDSTATPELIERAAKFN